MARLAGEYVSCWVQSATEIARGCWTDDGDDAAAGENDTDNVERRLGNRRRYRTVAELSAALNPDWLKCKKHVSTTFEAAIT